MGESRNRLFFIPKYAIEAVSDRSMYKGGIGLVQYKLGDAVTHPKFGHGIVEKINQRSGGVHLHIRFDGEVKCIDQKWLSRKKYT